MKKNAPPGLDAYEAIFEYATTSILLVNEKGVIKVANPQTYKQFGYEPGELLDRNIAELIPDEIRVKHNQLIEKYFNHPERRPMGIGLELSAKKKNGELFPVEISLGHYHAPPQPVMAIVFLTDITHRKLAELALYEDEKRLRDIIQSISDAFMGFTNDWRYLYLNDKALTILGKTRNEILGKTIWEIFPHTLGEKFDHEFRKRQAKELTPVTFKTQYGDTWWEIRIVKYNSGMALFCSDITETTYALEAQHQSEEQFSVIFNSSPSAISITELHSGIVKDINQTHTLLFGFTKNELIGKTMNEVGILRNAADRDDLIDKIHQHGPVRNHELISYNKFGNPIHLLVAADIIHLAEKEYLLVASTDNSANKKAMEELQRSEERFAKAFRLSPVALSISAMKDGRMIEVNNSFLELFGYEMSEVIGKTAGDLQMYTRQEDHSGTIAELTRQGYVRNKELTCRTKGGIQIQVIFSMEMIELRGEACVITTALNITDKKKAEENLKIYTDLLEQKVTERTLELTHALEREKEVSDMKSRFVSIASHEFRTPLSTILSSTYLLEQLKDGEDKTRHFNRIRSAVKNLTFILTEFLSLDKLEQRKVTVENEIFDLDTLALEAIDEVRIAYRLSLPVDYIHTGPRLLLQDKRIIRNLLLNLVSNAAKYSPADKPIQLRTMADESHLTIQVIDQGIGIPLEDQKYIFTKFFRAHNASHIQGTGLGLSIARRYVELLDGNISFKSTPGIGTEFKITLPVQKLSIFQDNPVNAIRE